MKILEIKITCDHCGKQKLKFETKNWELQCLHIYNDENKYFKYLTCEKCKELNPHEFLDKIQSQICD